MEQQQVRLLHIIQRTLALSIGRGMLTLGTQRPIITQEVAIPKFTLQGTSASTGSQVALKDPLSSVMWPDFHNGVASGLRLSSSGREHSQMPWIAYHR